MMQLPEELDIMLTIFILLSLLLAGLALASFLKFLIEATYKSVKGGWLRDDGLSTST